MYNNVSTTRERVSNLDYQPIDIEKIIDNLYIGDESSTSNQKKLLDLNIRAVITVALQLTPKFSQKTEHLHIPVKDHKKEEIIKYFESTNQFIDKFVSKQKSKQGVLVHCRMGKSRSVTIICAYLIGKVGMSADNAVNFLRRKRKGANPNEGFMYQLKKYEKELMKVKQNKTDE